MDNEQKHNLAKKAAIAVGGRAAVAGASAINWVMDQQGSQAAGNGSEEQLEGYHVYVNASDTYVDDGLETYEGDYEDVTAVSDLYAHGETAAHSTGAMDGFDTLSFGEAFRAARLRHGGGGGVFEWHGNYYNTYTSEEYENLSDDAMDNLYLSYKRAAGGNAQTIDESLRHTITSDLPGEAASPSVPAQPADMDPVAADSRETEPDDSYDEPETDEGPDEDFDGVIGPDDVQGIDFTNLYT